MGLVNFAQKAGRSLLSFGRSNNDCNKPVSPPTTTADAMQQEPSSHNNAFQSATPWSATSLQPIASTTIEVVPYISSDISMDDSDMAVSYTPAPLPVNGTKEADPYSYNPALLLTNPGSN
jgi:hypothetical protein